MKRKIVFLVNPVSGTKNKAKLIAHIASRCDSEKVAYRIMETNPKGDCSSLLGLIANENVTDVVVCGGDGTINYAASALRESPVNIGIIPMGSGNGLAYAAGIPMDADKALTVILEGFAVKVDGFLINGRFSCMLCGLGFDAQVAHDFSLQKKRGLSTYIKQTLLNFVSAPVYPFVITDGNTEIKTDAFFISIANSNQFGNNFRIAPRASLTDGLLDIVIVNKMSKIKMLYAIVLQLRLGQVVPVAEKKFHAKDIHYFQTKNLIIENPALAPFHVDGDPCNTAKRFEIRILENAFSLLQPAH
jgi:diacylglycerol kinase (ATP)